MVGGVECGTRVGDGIMTVRELSTPGSTLKRAISKESELKIKLIEKAGSSMKRMIQRSNPIQE